MNKTKQLTTAAIIAALYTVLTYLTNLFGLANGVIQVRFSEMLTVLPVLTPAAIPGLTVGCLLSNLLTGCALWDVIFGSFATLLGALGTRYFAGKLLHKPYLAPVFPVLSNAEIVPLVLRYTYGAEGSLLYFAATVGAGEILSAGVLGTLLLIALKKRKIF